MKKKKKKDRARGRDLRASLHLERAVKFNQEREREREREGENSVIRSEIINNSLIPVAFGNRRSTTRIIGHVDASTPLGLSKNIPVLSDVSYWDSRIIPNIQIPKLSARTCYTKPIANFSSLPRRKRRRFLTELGQCR